MISVVVTVYNKERYLKKCIESIENNTYKDIEVIIVEDCSTDNSMGIINEMLQKYDNIILIKNKINCGAGYSRNIGIKAAKGEWLSLIDADEWVNEDYFETYLKKVDNDTDIIYGSCTYYAAIFPLNKILREDSILNNINDCILNFDVKRLQYFNMSLIKRKLFDNFEYCKERYVEEVPTLLLLLFHSKKIQTISYNGYNINVDPKSLTQTNNLIYNDLCVLNNIIPSIKYIIKYDEKLGKELYNKFYLEANKLGYSYRMDYDDFLKISPFFDNICDFYNVNENSLKKQKEYVLTYSANKSKLIN